MSKVVTLVCAAALWLVGCGNTQEQSVRFARSHVDDLAKVIDGDVAEVRAGLPEGAKRLAELFVKDEPREEKASAAREALGRARDKVQDLRVAKSTFFAVAGLDGVVIRSDQETDRLAGKGLFGPFPELRAALSGKAVETRGAMDEASGVQGKPDGQWVTGIGVRSGDAVKGLYVTGWSWSAYAYRLEFHLRSLLKSELKENDKLPLIYVFLVVDRAVYGAPVSPQLTQDEIAKLDPMAHLGPDGVFAVGLKLTERDYGLAVKAVAALGPKVGVAVLRSET